MESSGKSSISCCLALIKTQQRLVLEFVRIANILLQILVHVDFSGPLAGSMGLEQEHKVTHISSEVCGYNIENIDLIVKEK